MGLGCLNSQPFHLHFRHTEKEQTKAEPLPGGFSFMGFERTGRYKEQINEPKCSLYRFSPSLLMKG